MRRGLVVGIVCILLFALSSCSSTRRTPVDKGVAELGTTGRADEGQRVAGYTTIDGVYHRFKGRVRLYSPDTLEFSTEHWRWNRQESEPPKARLLVPRDSLQTLYMVHPSAIKTALAIIGVGAATLAVLVGIAIATKESCPFLYSYDGDHYVFDGEPYGGATMKGLERADWSELEHLAVLHGECRLLVTNEVDETQHTNSLALLVVDHPQGTTVVMDKEGRPHAFRALTPLRAAYDEDGRDLRVWLRDNDEVSWYPDLKRYSQFDSLSDTRNHITLEFPRPVGLARAYLVTSVATGQWGSHMIRTMLGMRGRRVDEFYAAINGSEAARQRLLAWDDREELFELSPEIQCGMKWERQDFIPAGGPFISESRAVPLDLGQVEGDRLRIRINPPIGFWNLNSFHIAWDESDAHETELHAETASRMDGIDVVGVLAAADERYLDFPKTGDWAELIFHPPPARPGMSRTFFARTRGWYELHLHQLGEPDLAGLSRLTSEPGYAVRRSLREYADYLRTGALLGVEHREDVDRR